jgi:hypothetical protein
MITLLIPQLKVFEIRFYYLYKEKILYRFKGFHTDFWLKQHKWYIVCEFAEKSALMYSIPYGLHMHRLESDINIDCNASINKSNLYDKIDLSLIDSNKPRKFFQIFSNLEQLQCSIQHSNDLIFILKHLSKLSHIRIKYPGDLNLSMEYINQNLQSLASTLNKTFLYEFHPQDTLKNKNTHLNIWLSYSN